MLASLRFPIARCEQGGFPMDNGGAYQVENFALRDEVMKRVHDLLNGGSPIPPVHIQNIDVRGSQFLESGLNGDVQRFCVSSTVVCFVSDVIIPTLEVGRILDVILECGRRLDRDLPWLQ
jgi:hypothetical protein